MLLLIVYMISSLDGIHFRQATLCERRSGSFARRQPILSLTFAISFFSNRSSVFPDPIVTPPS